MIPLKKIKPKSVSIKMTQNSYFKRDVPSNILNLKEKSKTKN